MTQSAIVAAQPRRKPNLSSQHAPAPTGAGQADTDHPPRHPSNAFLAVASSPVNLAAISAAATVPDWISAVSTAVIALGVVAAAIGWMRQQAKKLRDPGEAPGGSSGETREIIEDAARDEVADRTYRKQWQQTMQERQQGQPLKDRWQRHLRRQNRKRAARKRKRAAKQLRMSEPQPERSPDPQGGPGER